MNNTRNRVCLWFDSELREAAEFYQATFPDTAIERLSLAPADYPGGHAGDLLVLEMTIVGIPAVLLRGGPVFPQTEAFSFQIVTKDQAETDRYWDAIVGNGGQESQCGWCKDRWGVSWQITPRQLIAWQDDPPAVAARVFDAMLRMRKIDVAAIEAARKG